MSKSKICTALVVGVLAQTLVASSLSAAEYKWGAISLDMSDLSPDGGYGIGGGDTKEEAGENAQKFCAEGGAKGCKVTATYEKCGSVATIKSGKGGGWGIGATKDEAAARAMRSCGGDEVCKVVVSDCN